MGTMHLGVWSVKGRRRVPLPAANKIAGIEILWVDNGGIDVGEYLKLACTAYVIPITGRAIRNDFFAI